MTDSEERFEELKTKFRQHGYRITPQRVVLLRLLSTSEAHPSANWLYERIKEQFPTTSLATIYKTLSTLTEMSEVLKLGSGHDDNRYDGRKTYPHPHFVCLRCGRIVDLQMELAQDLEQEATELSGYEITGHRLDFYGICFDCQGGE